MWRDLVSHLWFIYSVPFSAETQAVEVARPQWAGAEDGPCGLWEAKLPVGGEPWPAEAAPGSAPPSPPLSEGGLDGETSPLWRTRVWAGPEEGVAVEKAAHYDPSSSRNFSESRAGEMAKIHLVAPGEPGSVEGAPQVPNSDFVPKCEISGKDALSALHRAGSRSADRRSPTLCASTKRDSSWPQSLPQFCHSMVTAFLQSIISAYSHA